eukprot:jgi/Picre1/32819/NNA_008149.t1
MALFWFHEVVSECHWQSLWVFKKDFGEEILQIKDVSSLSLRRPVDRGYVINWEIQKEIWGYGFKSLLEEQKAKGGGVAGILLTEPYLNLPSMREAVMKLVLEDMKFASVLLCTRQR